MKEKKRKLKLSTMIKNPDTAKASTLNKLRQLQRIINPSCHGDEIMNLDTLFQKTADQISLLQEKVNVLKNLYTMFGV